MRFISVWITAAFHIHGNIFLFVELISVSQWWFIMNSNCAGQRKSEERNLNKDALHGIFISRELFKRARCQPVLSHVPNCKIGSLTTESTCVVIILFLLKILDMQCTWKIIMEVLKVMQIESSIDWKIYK